MKKLLCFILISLFVIGCAKKHSKDDIGEYVKKILGSNNFSVSEEYKIVTDEDGYSDKLWTVVDKKNNITFHVLDNYYWALLGTENMLLNDYNDAIFIKYYDELQHTENITYTVNDSEGLYDLLLTCKYENKESLSNCVDHLISYKEYYNKKGFNLNINYKIIPNSIISFSDLDAYTYRTEKLDFSSYEYHILKYIKYGLGYQIDSIINEATPEEIAKIMNDKDTYWVYKLVNDEKVYYNDIIGKSSGVSFGTMYKILKSEKFNVKGTPTHYTVTLKDGTKYEFSYDFNDEYYGINETYGAYYLKNGEKEKFSSPFTTGLSKKEIKEFFNLDIGTIRKGDI